MLPGANRSLNLSKDFAMLTQTMIDMKSHSKFDHSIGEDAKMSHASRTVSPISGKEYYILNVDSATSPLAQDSKIDETLSLPFQSLR